MESIYCACGCGLQLKRAAYPSQQATYRRGHNPSVKLTAADVERRFWSKVQKTETCWLWTGEASSHFGYGRLHVNGRRTRAHRYSWELHNGAVPEGKFLLHSCDNPRCVRPEHLRVGTQRENMADKTARGRQARGQRHGMSATSKALRAMRGAA